jgi:hypothetical protein
MFYWNILPSGDDIEAQWFENGILSIRLDIFIS